MQVLNILCFQNLKTMQGLPLHGYSASLNYVTDLLGIQEKAHFHQMLD